MSQDKMQDHFNKINKLALEIESGDANSIIRQMRKHHGEAICDKSEFKRTMDKNNEQDLVTLSMLYSLAEAMHRVIRLSEKKAYPKQSGLSTSEISLSSSQQQSSQSACPVASVRSNVTGSEISVKMPPSTEQQAGPTTEYISGLTTEGAERMYQEQRRQRGGNASNEALSSSSRAGQGHNFRTYNDITKPTLVNFWSHTCGPSNAFLPTWNTFVQNAKEKYPNLQVYGVDVGSDPQGYRDIIARAGVTAYPALVLFKDGKSYQKVGNMPLKTIEDFVDRFLLPQV